MRITAIKRLERSQIGNAALELTIDEVRGIANVQVQVIQLHTFDNGWTLFLVDASASNFEANMILANRDGEVNITIGQPEFTLKPQPQAQCRYCKQPIGSQHRPSCSHQGIVGPQRA